MIERAGKVDRQSIDSNDNLDVPHTFEGDREESEKLASPEVETMTDDPEQADAALEEDMGVEGASQHLRMLEALLFAASEPLGTGALAERLPEGADVSGMLDHLQDLYKNRGVVLISVAGCWAFRTAPDLSFLMERERVEPRRLSKAAIETLSIISYHQPVTRAEIEDIRGVAVSKGTVDLLMEIGWVRLRGRRRTPGRPVTYGTTDDFLDHFGLERLGDLPGMEELKGAGLLDGRLPPGFSVPIPQPSSADEEASLDEVDDENEDISEFQTDFLEGADRAGPGEPLEVDEPGDEPRDEIES